jgi:hypothetical protein
MDETKIIYTILVAGVFGLGVIIGNLYGLRKSLRKALEKYKKALIEYLDSFTKAHFVRFSYKYGGSENSEDNWLSITMTINRIKKER